MEVWESYNCGRSIDKSSKENRYSHQSRWLYVTYFFAVCPSPTLPFAPPRFSFCLLLRLCALVSALDPSPSPIVLAARG
jgi:hypothetical protein